MREVDVFDQSASSWGHDLDLYGIDAAFPRGEFGPPQTGLDEKGKEREGPRGCMDDVEVRTDHCDGLAYRVSLDFEIERTSDLPPEFTMVIADYEKIRAHVAEHGDTKPIPGVRVYRVTREHLSLPPRREAPHV